MHIYKVMQTRSTGEYLHYLIRKRPLHPLDAAFMHYRILEHWQLDAIGA